MDAIPHLDVPAEVRHADDDCTRTAPCLRVD